MVSESGVVGGGAAGGGWGRHAQADQLSKVFGLGFLLAGTLPSGRAHRGLRVTVKFTIKLVLLFVTPRRPPHHIEHRLFGSQRRVSGVSACRGREEGGGARAGDVTARSFSELSEFKTWDKTGETGARGVTHGTAAIHAPAAHVDKKTTTATAAARRFVRCCGQQPCSIGRVTHPHQILRPTPGF